MEIRGGECVSRQGECVSRQEEGLFAQEPIFDKLGKQQSLEESVSYLMSFIRRVIRPAIVATDATGVIDGTPAPGPVGSAGEGTSASVEDGGDTPM
jgi:hypothetical protein